MRRGTIVAAFLASLGIVLPAAAQAPSVGRVPRFADMKESARNLLLKRVEEVDWSDTTFDEIMGWLRRQGEDQGINVIVNYRQLQPEGVDRDSLVTLKLQNVSIAQVLAEVLDQLVDDDVLRLRAYENIIKVTTRRDVERRLVTVVYRIEDLLFRIPDMGRSAPTVDLDAASRQGGQGGGGGGGQSIFGGAGGGSSSEDLEEEEAEIEELADDLIAIIQAQIEPTSWTLGGGTGTIARFQQKTLIVTNTIDVHEKLAGFYEEPR